jgi:hypothetical protein
MTSIKKCGLIEGATYPTNHTGDLVVVRVHNNYEVEVRFIETDNTVEVEAKDVRSGNVRDRLYPSISGVGYLGYGVHTSHVKEGKRAYTIWRDILTRCYSKKHSNYEYYGGLGVYVCDEWLNFQNFANWYYNNKPKDGKEYHLDKDGLHKGEGPKVYSPTTCQFITPSENYALQVYKKPYKTKTVKLALEEPSNE